MELRYRLRDYLDNDSIPTQESDLELRRLVFQSRDNKVPTSKARHLGEMMYQRSQVFLENKRIKCEQLQKHFPHKPVLISEVRNAKLLPRTVKSSCSSPKPLVRRLSKDELSGFIERNYTIRQASVPKEKIDLQCVFEPELNCQSLRLARKLALKDLYERGIEAAIAKKQHAEELRKQRSEAEVSSCTFSPKVRAVARSPQRLFGVKPPPKSYAELRRNRSR